MGDVPGGQGGKDRGVVALDFEDACGLIGGRAQLGRGGRKGSNAALQRPHDALATV